mgnify:CR=1 FL=1
MTTDSGCAWSATTTDSWIHTTSSGSGSGTVNYSVDANAGAARNGTITVADVRDSLGSSRKFTLPIVNWLDRKANGPMPVVPAAEPVRRR